MSGAWRTDDLGVWMKRTSESINGLAQRLDNHDRQLTDLGKATGIIITNQDTMSKQLNKIGNRLDEIESNNSTAP